MKLWVSGEGTTDIGSLALDRMSDKDYPGVLQVLVQQAGLDAEIIGGDKWCAIPKLRVGSRGRDAEAHTVRALRLRAKEAGAHALAFIRDRDGVRARETQIEQALAEDGLPTAGVAVVEQVEHWLLAVAGVQRAHQRSKKQTQESLAKVGLPGEKNTAEYVEWLEERTLEEIPADAASLRTWLERVRALADVGRGQ